jgi:hypothetical protein
VCSHSDRFEIDSIEILEVNKSYPILYASRIVRGASCIFLMAILPDADHIVKIYMPVVTDSEVQDNLILTINTRYEKYNLIYTGLCEEENIHKFRLEPYPGT